MGLCMFILFIYLFIFSATILSGPYLWNRYSQRLQIECAAQSCGLILHCCLQSNSLRYFLFIYFFFRHDFVRAIGYLWNRYSQRLQIECAAWSCGLILHCCLPSNSLRYFYFIFFLIFFFSATILSGPFASLISSLINIISLLLTTFDWTKVRGSAPRSHTGPPRTCLISDPRRGCYMGLPAFIFFFFFFLFFLFFPPRFC